MSIPLNDRADSVGQMVRSVLAPCQHAAHGVDGMKLIQILAGVFVETALLFEEPDTGLEAIYANLAAQLGCEPAKGPIRMEALPAPFRIDSETEQGRAIARRLFIDWLYCPRDFLDLGLFAAHHLMIAMEEDGQPRAETFRLLIECANLCMGFEICAQELCDVVIDRKIGLEGWSLAESISGLSAVSGQFLALSFARDGTQNRRNLPEYLDKVAHVMTQEAIRLGIPAGSDWRFGLAANDQPASAPYELIAALEPVCKALFATIGMDDQIDQAVACAKATGRMLALASGGERPEIEPVIAKPLAMAAMTETYNTVCREYAVLSG